MGILPPQLGEAFKQTPRASFLPDEAKNQAEWDVPLPIGFGQTNSQPYTVALMLFWLDPSEGERVLDVGSGSGWTTALLSHLVGPTGSVVAVEIIPELVDFGRANCAKQGIKNVTFHKAGNNLGWEAQAPYDCILVSAAAETLPLKLIEQLAPEGRLVVPVQNDVLVVDKTSKSSFATKTHPGFSFVPLVQ